MKQLKELARRYRLIAGVILTAALLLVFPQFTDSRTAPAVTAVSYTLADGTRLTGYLSLPPDCQEGEKYPAILLIHGWRGVNRHRPQGLAQEWLKLKPHQEYLRRHYVVFSGEYYADYGRLPGIPQHGTRP